MIDSWDRLRVFAAVARHASVTEAASDLHLTGPAVSHHVRALERALGTRLVERAGRGIRLTVAGRMLADRAREVAGAVTAAESQIEALHEQVSGPVRLGASGSVLRSVTPALGEYRRTNPQVDLEVLDAETVDLLPRLLRDELDLVIAESWSSAPRPVGSGLVSSVLRVEQGRVAVPTHHRAAERDVVSIAEVADETWVTCATGSDPYAGLCALINAEAQGKQPRIAFQVNDFASSIEVVRAGLALALVTDLSQGECRDDVVLLTPVPQITRTLCLVRRPTGPRPAVALLEEALHDASGCSTGAATEPTTTGPSASLL